MLEVSALNKTYANGVKAINNIDLKIGKGMFGLLGPNGAGKSSLMRTIATLQEPDSGSIKFNSLDVLAEKENMRSILGYLPQDFGVYPNSNAEDLLHHLAILKGITDSKKRADMVAYLLEMTNLTKHKKKNLGGYSGGMRQRFGIAQALLGSPQVIIVDEPTAGLDPEERDRFHNLLSSIGENVTVILSTHIVSDVSDLCNDMAIINGGQVLVQKSPSEALKLVQGKVWKQIVSKDSLESVSAKHKVISSRLTHGKVMVRVFSDGSPGAEFEAAPADLEDVYFSYIKSYLA
ncbi:ABC transporter ATP-binding protein [Bdellovibrio svalbardensis]|uniref:ABC transporter ATP-binding protein n=1 Tax=Bdellovibrio svalbardensis TaxID=2972972 RepID=A0ABT6DH41_9BACT|nr:ABC transporter ATP-binding protein [Bdellovibrio svalbardensis]MDG0815814.1 ABC transporter ATP-binding protein [Bdellovibrio svalbardensis]